MCSRAVVAALLLAGSLVVSGCAIGSGPAPQLALTDSTGVPVAVDPADLTPVRIISTDVAMPALPTADADRDSYAQAGPGPTELTLVIFGSGCASRPAAYRNDAAAGSLEIVSEVIIPAVANGCTEQRAPWTTVIVVPATYRDYTSVSVDGVSVDGVDTVLLG